MSKKILLIITLLVQLSFLAFNSYSFAAATSEGTIYIDWNSLSVSGIDVTWEYGYDWYSPAVQINSDDAVVTDGGNFGWEGIVDDTLIISGSYGKLYSDPDKIEASSFAVSNGSSVISAYSRAQIVRSGVFTANESGTLNITVSFHFSGTVSSENLYDNSSIYYTTYLSFFDPNNIETKFDFDSYSDSFLISDGEEDVANTDILCIQYVFTEGQTVEFWASVYQLSNVTSSPVPIPGAVWLLGTGLVGLAGWRRKLKR